MRVWLISAVIVALVVFALVSTERPKNVVIFAFDGLQARHLKAYGYERATTPNLDAFLAESYLFERAVSAAPWTVPSFMSIFTSRYPSEHKLTNKLIETENGAVKTANMQELAPSIQTLAEILKRHGYSTAAFTGDAGVSKAFGYGAGFDTYVDDTVFGGFEKSVPSARDWLRVHKNEKFFLFVHGYDVHGQHAPAEGYDYRYADESYTGQYTGSIKEQAVLRERGLRHGALNVTEADKQFWRAVYDEKIARADERFGVFLRDLEALGLKEKTIVVVVSDHGTEFFEHGRVDHGHTLYSELLDVLFAIHVPGREGRAITDVVSTLDLAPTVLSILGIRDTAADSFRGMDLGPAFHGRSVAHDVYSETDYRLYTHKRSITTTDGWKFILTRETGARELYHLATDLDESTNLADTEPEKAYELEQRLLAHLKKVGDNGPWHIGCLPVYADQCR